MSKPYTTEDKQRFVNEAIAEFREAQKHVDIACTLMKRCGIGMCGQDVFGDAYETDAEIELHVYEGIRKLAKLVGQELRNPLNIFKKKQNDKAGVVIDGILFYQLGDPRDTKSKMYYR